MTKFEITMFRNNVYVSSDTNLRAIITNTMYSCRPLIYQYGFSVV